MVLYRQILQTIISNIEKYTKSLGTISIYVILFLTEQEFNKNIISLQ